MPDYRFTTEWFTLAKYGKRLTIPKESTKQRYERLLMPLAGKVEHLLEIGVCEGQSTVWLLENLKPKKWVGIDPWQAGRQKDWPMHAKHEENFWHNMEVAARNGFPSAAVKPNKEYRFRISDTVCEAIKARSQDYLRADVDVYYPGQPFDLIIVDGDHTGPATMLDAVLCWRKLAIGGLMIFDDFDRRWHNARACAHEAILGFWMAHEHFCDKVFEDRWQFWVRKKAQ